MFFKRFLKRDIEGKMSSCELMGLMGTATISTISKRIVANPIIDNNIVVT